MTARFKAMLAGLSITVLLLAYLNAPTHTTEVDLPPSPSPARVVRAIEMAAHRPGMSKKYVEEQMQASDERAIDTPVADLLVAFQPTTEQRTAYYDAHRDRFGQRSLEESSKVIAQLLQIEHARAKLKGIDEHAP